MPLKFEKLAYILNELESTSSNQKMEKIMADFIRELSPDDIEYVSYMLIGRISPIYKSIKIGMAEKMILKSISAATGNNEEKVKKLFSKLGDLGLVAEQLNKNKKSDLTIKQVFDTLYKIASEEGAGSKEKKKGILSSLLKNSSKIESKYIPRIIMGNLRTGASDKTLLHVLADLYAHGKKDRKKIEHAYNICPDIGLISKEISKKGLESIEKINIVIGKPIQMMLAQRVKKITLIEDKMSFPIICEEKYDGERVQVHYDGKKITLFSRRLSDISNQFPDVSSALKDVIESDKFIVEGEIVPISEDETLLPFQKLMQRKRKENVKEYVKKVPVRIYLFDLLYLDGKSLLKTSYPKRRKSLRGILKKSEIVKLANGKKCRDTDCIEDFFNWCIENGSEGIIAKSCKEDSIYTAGARGYNWIKWKQEYQEMVDTFDLVVVGAYYGKGKRKGSYGSLLCCVYNSGEDIFETFCKLGSGFTDDILDNFNEKFKKYKIDHKPARLSIKDNIEPDVYFNPEIVIEVLGAQITESPSHTTGGGLALRFPRFKKYRDDKKPEQATTTKEVTEIYSS